ncbi:MAG: ribonuclease HI [Leptolyngbyaceae cyanobacterium MAG.088]|nr:ribonuclease HI [Leptolyngbyaceae cyanobacterium MAG.088]
MTDLPDIKAIYTDGACSGNPGPGGWGTVLYFKDGSVHELGGYAPGTTNNRMEMQAAIAALEFLQQHDYDKAIELNTDSKYVIQGITQWMRGWKRKGWKTSAGKAVLNKDLWLTLDDLTQGLKSEHSVDIDWKYVKGHAGNVGNERCDTIARSFSQQRPIGLKQSIGGSSQAATKTKSVAKDVSKATSNPQKKSPQQTELSLPPLDPNLSDMSDTRINRVSNMLTLLQTADALAKQGYLITTSELVVLTGVSASELAKRGDDWTWRNWTVSCVSSESDQEKFWQLERIED